MKNDISESKIRATFIVILSLIVEFMLVKQHGIYVGSLTFLVLVGFWTTVITVWNILEQLVLMEKSNLGTGFYLPLIISFSIGGYMFFYYKDALILLLSFALPIGIFFFFISLLIGFLLIKNEG